MSEEKNIQRVVRKIIKGMREFSKEEIQTYVNNSKEIERRLLEKMHEEIN